MAKDLGGKIFIVHPENTVPAIAFLSPVEANRVEKELHSANIQMEVKEVYCFGNSLQHLFVLMEENGSAGLTIAFYTGKEANCMCKLLNETDNGYQVTEVSCFALLRGQVLAKYKLKYTKKADTAANAFCCDSCKTDVLLIRKLGQDANSPA
jgi:hypothetical protein